VTDPITPAREPTLALRQARALLASRGVVEPVALIGVRGYFGEMGPTPGNDPGVYDDAVFLVTAEACRGFVFNTDPAKFEPPSVTLKTGLWRYRPGEHRPLSGAAPYRALVHAGSPVWVTLHPSDLDDYRNFARKVNMDDSLPDVDAYKAALRGSRDAKLLPDGAVEWRMREHINIHRGRTDTTGSLGCQTVEPSMWEEFIGAVYRELAGHAQRDIPYLLVEARELPASRSDG
jgi:hypothetical protein